MTRAAFDNIADEIVQGIMAAMPLDGLYLDLHGAMVADHTPDGEATLLRRIRAATGPDLPIAVSLDLHANLSAALVDTAQIITIFRTYPHVDMAQTGARAMHRLRAWIGGIRAQTALRPVPFLIPLPAQTTDLSPLRDIYSDMAELCTDTTHADLALGFTAADIPDCRPAAIASAPNVAQAETLAAAIVDRLCAVEVDLCADMRPPRQAVAQAVASTAPQVILADVQDNPGAGATSDTTSLLRALAAGGPLHALMGLFHDPLLATAAHAAGEGAVIGGLLGGRSGIATDTPFEGRFRVIGLSDGRFRFTGPVYGGATANIGPCAALRLVHPTARIDLVVTSIRSQALDRAQFTHLGLDPDAAGLVALKSTAHFRADFAPAGVPVINVAAPGGFPCALDHVPYRNLTPGTRLGPRGPAFRRT